MTIAQMCDELNRNISPAMLVNHGIIDTAPNFDEKTQRGYICPFCGSGSGKNHQQGYRATGAGSFTDNKFYCHACQNADFDGHQVSPIDLFMFVRNVADLKDAVNQIAAEFGFFFPENADSLDAANGSKVKCVYNYSKDTSPYCISDSNSNGAARQERFDIMEELVTTNEAAGILKVSPITLRQWRKRKLFDVPFFTAQVTDYQKVNRVTPPATGNGQVTDYQKVNQVTPTTNCPPYTSPIPDRSVVDGGFTTRQQTRNPNTYPVVPPDSTTRVKMPMPRDYEGKKYYSATDVAKIIGVAKKTIWTWQNTLYMGAPIFTADARTHDGCFLYDVEKVMQLKDVYRKDWTRGSYDPPPAVISDDTAEKRKAIDGADVPNVDGVIDVKKQLELQELIDAEYKRLIPIDIAEAQKHIDELPENQRRGLSLETLRHFGFGYYFGWVHPKIRARAKYGDCKLPYSNSRRIIAPRGSIGYLARMLEIDQYDLNKEFWKQQCGKISLFNPDALSADNDIIIVVEGEIDAASIWQTDNNYAVVACPGGNGKLLINALKERCLFDKSFLILFDNDDAGRMHADSLQKELVKRGHRAAVKFLNDAFDSTLARTLDGKKADANFLLNYIGSTLKTFVDALLDEAREEFSREKEKPALDISDDYLNISFEQKTFLYSGGMHDAEYADRLVCLFPNQFRYMRYTDEWYMYCRVPEGGAIWKNYGQKKSCLNNFWRRLYEVLAENAANDDPKSEKFNLALAKRITDSKYISAAAEMLKGDDKIIIEPENINTDKYLFNCLNGVIDLKTGKLLPAAPHLYLTQQAPVIYRPGYHNPDVDKFLADIIVTTDLQPDPDTLNALLIALGSFLTGDVCNHKAIFFWGVGRNGKGTLTRLLQRVFGEDYSCAVDIENFLVGKLKSPGAPNPDFYNLRGRRLACVEELKEARRFDVPTIKKMTGGDRITARALHENYLAGGGFDPTHHLIFSGNKFPDIDNIQDPALIYRLVNFNFYKSFAENPDLDLDAKLSTTDALSGMLTRLVEGCQEWLKRKKRLVITPAMQLATQSYLDKNDWFADFIDEYCIFDAGAKVTKKAFEDKLCEKYPRQTSQFKPKRALTRMILDRLADYNGHKVSMANDSRGATMTLYGIGLTY